MKYLILFIFLTLSTLVLASYNPPITRCNSLNGRWQGIQTYQIIPEDEQQQIQTCIYETASVYEAINFFIDSQTTYNLVASLGGSQQNCPQFKNEITGMCQNTQNFGFIEFLVDPIKKYSIFGQANQQILLASSFYDQIESQTTLIQKQPEKYDYSSFNQFFGYAMADISNNGFIGTCEDLSGVWQIQVLTTGENGSGSVYQSNCLQTGQALVYSTNDSVSITLDLDDGYIVGTDEDIYCNNIKLEFSLDCNGQLLNGEFIDQQLNGIISNTMIIIQGQSEYLVLVRSSLYS